jgi:hypothetical protein
VIGTDPPPGRNTWQCATPGSRPGLSSSPPGRRLVTIANALIREDGTFDEGQAHGLTPDKVAG